MKKIIVLVGAAVFLIYVLRCWNVHDARYLSSFRSLEELRASDVGRCTCETAFRQDGKDFIGIRYRLRKLPPRFLFRWIGPLSEPYLIFDIEGQCDDRSPNYNDDGVFKRHWPALWKAVSFPSST